MRWSIKRYIIEEFSVEADTKEEALVNIVDPHSITIVKETIRKAK